MAHGEIQETETRAITPFNAGAQAALQEVVELLNSEISRSKSPPFRITVDVIKTKIEALKKIADANHWPEPEPRPHHEIAPGSP